MRLDHDDVSEDKRASVSGGQASAGTELAESRNRFVLVVSRCRDVVAMDSPDRPG